ncbi:MAG: hypothetical protein V8Q76_01660, partial [Bacteroides intestinalis]
RSANICRMEGSFVGGTYTFTIPAGKLRQFVAITPGSFAALIRNNGRTLQIKFNSLELRI